MSRSPLPLSRYSRGKSRRSLSSSYDRMARRNLAPSLNPPKISLLPSTIRESQKRKRFASTFVIARIEEDRFKRLPALPRDFVFDDSRAIFNIERLSTALIVPVAMMHAWPAHIDTASVAPRTALSPSPPPTRSVRSPRAPRAQCGQEATATAQSAGCARCLPSGAQRSACRRRRMAWRVATPRLRHPMTRPTGGVGSRRFGTPWQMAIRGGIRIRQSYRRDSKAFRAF